MVAPRKLPAEADRTTRLAAWLCALREREGLSQEALAERIGVDQSVVSRVEHAQRRVSVPELFAWAEALDVKWPELSAGMRDLWEPCRD